MSVQLGGLTITNPLYTPPKAPTPAPASKAAPGYFWKGADGKVYVQGSGGINAAGNWDANTANYWGAKGFHQTADSPAAQQSSGNTSTPQSYGSDNSTYTGGGSQAASKPVYEDKSADINVNQQGYNSVDSQVNSGVASVDSSLNNLYTKYDAEKNANEGNYRVQSDTNMNNLQKNKDAARINAAQGRRGLFGTLASLGALNGDGINLANDAVVKGANEDLSSASDNYSTNQNAVESAIQKFREEDAARRKDAADEANKEKTVVKGQGAKDRQTYLQRMSDDYRLEGNTGKADELARQVAALFPEIAAANTPTSGLSAQAAAYTAPQLAAYLSGVNNTTVASTPSTSGSGVIALPGLIASTKKQ